MTEIGSSAFDGCESLKTIQIPDSVISIKECTYSGCLSLEEVSIPDSIIEIEGGAFDGCESLRNVHIPASVMNIESDAFYGCHSIHYTVDDENEYYSSESGALFDKEKKILIVGYPLVHNGQCTIPDSVMVIAKYSFDMCTALTEIHIPDSVIWIEEYAFVGCESLNKVNIPSFLEIACGAFQGCIQAYFTVDEDNEYYSSKSGALYNKKRDSLLIGYSLVSNGECTIPDNVAVIGRDAFNYCSSLTVRIPRTVKKIESYAFGGCNSLKVYMSTPIELEAYSFPKTTTVIME